MHIKARESESGIHLDFVPMVDVLFNLLIFFLLATSLRQAEREMQVALPVAAAAGPISASLREIIINIDAQGQVIVAGRPTDDEQLRTIITDAVTANPEQKVTVRGDRTAPYGHIAHALDICKACKVQEPYLDTVLQE